MKASYQWLRALLPGLDAPAREIADRLTGAGLEVEGLSEYGAASQTVLLAQVRAVEPHPKRSGLTLVTVSAGETLRVVCGAPNVPPVGDWVVLAPLGATLPAVGLTVADREIGGVPSPGMLCSEAELGLSGHAEGIMTLAAGSTLGGTPLRPGMSLVEALPAAHDFVLDIGVTPNRPDALGHVGLARELAAIFDLPFALPVPPATAGYEGPEETRALVQVQIDDTERCPQYGAAVALDVQVGPSPAWVRYRLESLGVRAINTVVDVTNLLLLQFGQPTHAFDLDLLPERRILVRRAREGEPMRTLDGVERQLVADDLVITDGTRPVALAGVMGGENTEIRASTKRVLLECAVFAPRGIRRTSKRHGLSSEASFRFERGVDPTELERALAHGRAWLAQLAGARLAKGHFVAGLPLPARRRVSVRPSRATALLGVPISEAFAATALPKLGFELAGREPADAPEGQAESLAVLVPGHRPDVEREADLIEELMRMYGIGAIPTQSRPLLPKVGRSSPSVRERVRQAAIALGLSETVTYSFVSPAELEVLGAPSAAVRLRNPLREERSVMRTSLLPGLLEVVRRARRYGVPDVRIFALGARFLARQRADEGEAGLPLEVPSFALALAGTRSVGLAKPEPVDVYDAKGLALELVERVTRLPAQLEPEPDRARSKHLHPRGAARVLVGGRVVGTLGPLHPDVVDQLDVGGPVMVVELDVAGLETVGRPIPSYQPIPVLPAATRDLALVVHEDVPAGEVAAQIRQAAGELCESVELFDLFRGGSIPPEHRSLAFHLVYRDPKAATDPDKARTLTDKEVDERHQRVVAEVSKRFGAQLRG